MRAPTASAASSSPTAARSSSTRSEPGACAQQAQAAARARDRRGRAGGRLALARGSTCASSRPPTPISRPRSPPGGSARICCSGSTPSRSACRRCASGARTSAPLAAHFLRRYAARYRKPLAGLRARGARGALETPRVARQRARAGPHDRARGAHGAGAHGSARRIWASAPAAGAAARLEDLPLEEVERLLIRKALERHGGNVSQAAKALGLSRSALYRRLAAVMGSDRRRRPAGHESRVFAARARRRRCRAVVVAAGCSGPATHPLRVQVTLTLHRRRRVAHRGGPGARARAPAAADASPTCSPRCARATTRSARRGASPDDALGLALLEVNTLSETLRSQRLHALEATALLRRVIEEIDVAVFAFDGGAAAPAGEPRRRAAPRPARRAPARAGADALGLARLLDGETPAHPRGGVSRRRRAVGGARQYFSPGRAAAPAARAVRSEPRASRRGALGVAADRAGARPRDQQLARADQVDRREPRGASPSGRRARPTGSRTSARACR